MPWGGSQCPRPSRAPLRRADGVPRPQSPWSPLSPSKVGLAHASKSQQKILSGVPRNQTALPRGGEVKTEVLHTFSLWSVLPGNPRVAPTQSKIRRKNKACISQRQDGCGGPWVPWPSVGCSHCRDSGSQHGGKDPTPHPGQAHPSPLGPLFLLSLGCFQHHCYYGAHIPAFCDFPFLSGILGWPKHPECLAKSNSKRLKKGYLLNTRCFTASHLFFLLLLPSFPGPHDQTELSFARRAANTEIPVVDLWVPGRAKASV